MRGTSTYAILLFTVITVILVGACTDDPPVTPPLPGEGDTLAVTVQEVSPTSVTLQLTVNSVGEYRLDRDGATAWTGSITPPDTVIVDTNLLPSTEYRYTLMHIIDGSPVSTSPVTTVRTSDTSSHEFVWEVDTLFWPGTTTPAFFTARAMYAISATNVYMVGYSTGLARCWHWDGNEWSVFNLGPMGTEIVDVDGIDSTYIVFASQEQGITGFTGIVALDNGNVTMLPLPLGDEEGNGTRYRTCLHVAARDEIYLGSVQGVQRYNGVEWEWLLDSTETVGNEFYPQYIYKFPDGTLEMVTLRAVSGSDMYYRWKWESTRFIAIDSFAYAEADLAKIKFGHRIQGSGSHILSTGSGGTYIRYEDRWDKIHNEGGNHLAGTMNDFIVAGNWKYFWHYSGRTMKNLWDELMKRVPDINIVHAIDYIDGVVFISAELKGSRDVVMICGRR